jgi:agmatine deiminase
MSYYLPPEWAPQSAVMLTWPNRESYWIDTLAEIDAVFVNTVAAITPHEKVLISCLDEQHRAHILTLLKKENINLDQVKIYCVPSEDIWVRDHGPIAVLSNNQPIFLDFIFNGWGNKYPAQNDNLLTRKLHQQQAFNQTPLVHIPLVLEGGAIETDGCGTLLTTRSCVLSNTRNPEYTQQQIENYFQQFFGVSQILWLEHGALAGDDTDGHIDTLARFVNPHTICYISCNDPNDEHFVELKKMEQELKNFCNTQGEPYKLIPLPLPNACYAQHDGRRLPASYANFLIINDAILVPTYSSPTTDEQALMILRECFPEREIIAVPCLAAVQWFGAVHCFTKQLPVGNFYS